MATMAATRAVSWGSVPRPSTKARSTLTASTGKLLEVAERGVAGAEVVDGEADAEGFESGQGASEVLDVVHEDAFGHLQAQIRRDGPRYAQHVLDQTGDVGCQHLADGEVDGDGHVGADGLPSDELAAGFFEDPGADGHDEAGLFGQGDELVGADQAPVGVLPAQEGFGADHGAGGQVDHGLVVDDELLRSSARCRPETVASRRSTLARRASSNSSMRPRPRSLARYIAASESRNRVSGRRLVVGDGDADAGRHRHLLAPEQEWLAQASRMRSAISSASTSEMSSQTITNSSPPNRATVSPGLIAPLIRSGRLLSRSSPRPWPSDSLTALK